MSKYEFLCQNTNFYIKIRKNLLSILEHHYQLLLLLLELTLHFTLGIYVTGGGLRWSPPNKIGLEIGNK